MSRANAPKISVQKFPPPLPLAWAFLPPGPGHAARLHKLHYRAIWRSLKLAGRIEMVFLLLLWPFLLLPRLVEMTSRNSAMVKARTGKSVPHQMLEQVCLAAR